MSPSHPALLHHLLSLLMAGVAAVLVAVLGLSDAVTCLDEPEE